VHVRCQLVHRDDSLARLRAAGGRDQGAGGRRLEAPGRGPGNSRQGGQRLVQRSGLRGDIRPPPPELTKGPQVRGKLWDPRALPPTPHTAPCWRHGSGRCSAGSSSGPDLKHGCHAGGRADPDCVPHRHLVTPHLVQCPRHARRLLWSNRALRGVVRPGVTGAAQPEQPAPERQARTCVPTAPPPGARPDAGQLGVRVCAV
jgi:hypothetical protein